MKTWKAGNLVKTNRDFSETLKTSCRKCTGEYLMVFDKSILYNIRHTALKELMDLKRKETDTKVIQLEVRNDGHTAIMQQLLTLHYIIN